MKLIFRLLFIIPVILLGEEYVLSLGDFGSARYLFQDNYLLKIERVSPHNQVVYSHEYHYDSDGKLISESLIGGLGEITCSEANSQNPYGNEFYSNDFEEPVLQKLDENHQYDDKGRVVTAGDSQYVYDDENKLTQVIKEDLVVEYIYDDNGLRIFKKVNGKSERYCYLGINEIAIFDEEGELKELRLPGLSSHRDIFRPIAIETKDAIYAPIHDIQGNIVKLIDIVSNEVIFVNHAGPFGEGLSQSSPTAWIFSGKNFDSDTGLVYFGHRFYSPALKQWLTPDPALQTSDLYQYCFNNPLKYMDPDGRFVIAIPLVWGGAVIGEALIDLLIGASISYLGYEAVKHGNKYLNRLGEEYESSNAYFYEKILEGQSDGLDTMYYFPDRQLPRNEITKEPLPDCDRPHTQRGLKHGSKGDYPQAREFDQSGKPVKDIDFTDHGRPSTHPNPHVHEYKDNPTGGTRQRGPAKQLKEEKN